MFFKPSKNVNTLLSLQVAHWLYKNRQHADYCLRTSGLDQGLEKEVRITQFVHPRMPRLPFVGKLIYFPVKINPFVKTWGNSYHLFLYPIYISKQEHITKTVSYREESFFVPMPLIIITHKVVQGFANSGPQVCFCMAMLTKMGFHIFKGMWKNKQPNSMWQRP